MAPLGRASLWPTDGPAAWPDAPAEMTVTTLGEIEACPRRWALGAAQYPSLWTGRGYPPRIQVSALAGTVIHLALENVTKAFIGAGCTSIEGPMAPQVMKDLGGYTRVLNECIDLVLERVGGNPRAARLVDFAARSLRAQVPDLRTRAQTMMCRLRLPEIIAHQASDRRPKSRRPLTAGVFPEIELRATQIGWKGKADLLVLSPNTCEITDFKTGAASEVHRFQIRVYALLWSRDVELNPERRLADGLILRYSSGDVEVPAPTEAELDDLEREIVAWARIACQTVSEVPPEARPDAERCRYCNVRQLCSDYWTAETQRRMAEQVGDRRLADVEVTITRRHGPASWDAVVELSRHLPAGRPVVLRSSSDLAFRVGARLRVLDAVTVNSGDGTDPAIISLGTLSETYAVA